MINHLQQEQDQYLLDLLDPRRQSIKIVRTKKEPMHLKSTTSINQHPNGAHT